MQLTLMLYEPHSAARRLLSATTPAFAEQYATFLGIARRCPQVDSTLGRVEVDLGQLCGVEVQVVQGPKVVLELGYGARSDEGGRYGGVAQGPRDCHLGE